MGLFLSLPVLLKCHDSKETVVFPPQNYYVNQLKFFADVLDEITPNISLEQTYERILLMEEIYKSAKPKVIVHK